MKMRFRHIDSYLYNGPEIQQSNLMKMVKYAKNTVYGKEFHFKDIKNYEDFKRQVPIREYEALAPYINRNRDGEQNVLWPTMIKWFSKSSGTTDSKSKFIPVSFESIKENHLRGGQDIFSWYCESHLDSQVFTGKSLRLGGSSSVNSINHESYYGDLSAIIVENLPLWAEIRSTPNQRISLLPEWEEKLEAMATATIQEDVTSLVGVPSWMLVLSKYILKKTGANNLKEVWPNLELYVHGGVSFVPYRNEFKKLVGPNEINYTETYNATEGFFAVQDQFPGQGMLLLIDHAIFYEFVPLNEYVGEGSKAISLGEVEIGETYAMIITTKSGLWRYSIGDTIRFVSKNPYRIEIVGRTKHFINAFGEELMIDNAASALARACNATGASIKDYSAAPIYMDGNKNGAHEWIIEFNNPPENLEVFGTVLDNALKEINSDYEAKRHKNIALGFPVIHQAKEKVFYTWLKSKGKLGGQNKVPRLSNNRQVLEELLEINAH
jgi:hypothetical protein